MTNEELQMLKDLFSTVGEVSSAGFDAMVRYTFASGLTWLIVGGSLFLLSAGVFLTGLLKEFSDDDFNGILCLSGAAVGLVALIIVGENLVDVIEPTGATVRELLKAAASK
jgi:hypothetical protein